MKRYRQSETRSETGTDDDPIKDAGVTHQRTAFSNGLKTDWDKKRRGIIKLHTDLGSVQDDIATGE